MVFMLTEAEKNWFTLLGEGDEGLERRNRLEGIRGGIMEVWSTPRVIPNFTDHGFSHNQRVIAKLWQLYQQRTPRLSNLLPEEVEVLLAAAYLHDIGMQCTSAELFSRVGAKVRSTLPANYSSEEQTEIRKHHHLLSAEMIQWGFNVAIGGQLPRAFVAVKRLPGDLITPIKHVVRYHSQLDVEQCPKTFLGTRRLRLLAALLRFADELDICRDRVNINEVHLYPRPLPAEYWWWIHYYTTEIEISGYQLTFHLRLHPADEANHKHQLRVLIKDDFERKNNKIVRTLAGYGIPLVYQEEEWEFDVNILRLSDEVKRYVEETLQQRTQILWTQLKRAITRPSTQLSKLSEDHPSVRRYRPIMGGDSAAYIGGTAGTICCLVADESGIPYVLGSSSAFAGGGLAAIGTPIIQPAPFDGGSSDSDIVAHLARFIVPKTDQANLYDGAICRLVDESLAAAQVRSIGFIQGVGEPRLGIKVYISGRGSGLTEGIIEGIDGTIKIMSPQGLWIFENTFICSNRTVAGDSGAPVLNENHEIIGMVLAGSTGPQNITVALPIHVIIKALGVNVLVSPKGESKRSENGERVNEIYKEDEEIVERHLADSA